MAKFSGTIGYIRTVEAERGVWVPEETTHPCSGEWVRNTVKFQTSDNVNDNVNVANEVSIVANLYARQNFPYMRYIEFKEIEGVKWKITNVEVKYPRLILTIGGVYNG